MKFKYVVIVIVLLVLIVLYAIPLHSRNEVSKIIFTLNKTLKEGASEDVHHLFLQDAVFEYTNKRMPYQQALDVLNKKKLTHDFSGDMHVYRTDKLAKNVIAVTTITWFRIKGVSFEASEVIELVKTKEGWKIRRIFSDLSAFGNIFFDEPLDY